jgi:hypothetical protein
LDEFLLKEKILLLCILIYCRVQEQGGSKVKKIIDKEKWPVTYGCNEVSAIIPETPENLCKPIVQLKKRNRKRKIATPDLSGAF